MLDPDQIERAATVIAGAHRTLTCLDGVEPVGDDVPQTVADGYAVQHRVHQLAGLEPAAWKVGATSEIAQQFLGVDAPFLGRPSADRLVASGSSIRIDDWCCGVQAIEVEVGIRPTIDLDAETLRERVQEPLDLAPIVEVVPCIEVVDSRFGMLIGLPAPCLIADNGVACALVVGDPLDLSVDDIVDLAALPVRLDVSGTAEPVDPVEATAAAALGHPLNAVYTAATIAIDLGTPIRAGEVVSTGTCTGLQPAGSGTVAHATVGDGTVSVRFD